MTSFTSTTHSIQVGDWVSGTSIKDERFLGYVEEIKNNMFLVRVIDSDHQAAIGTVVKSQMKHVKKMSVNPIQTTAHLLNMIDLALSTRDQKWFIDLTNQLNKLQQSKTGEYEPQPGNDSISQRQRPCKEHR